MNLNIATLKLFNAVFVSDHKNIYEHDYAFMVRCIKNGYVLEPSIKPSLANIKDVEKVFGVSNEKANATFHKSWEVVAETSMEILAIEQIIHYITTYGYEQLGIYSNDTIYIPAEELNLPVNFDKIPLTVIRGINYDELYQGIISLVSSGIALSEKSLECLKTIVSEVDYWYNFIANGDLTLVTNREFKSFLYDFYKVVPNEPVEFLRYVIQKLTGETLIIKNDYLISKIKSADSHLLDELMSKSPDNLASIFLRYKPLFLAMKSISQDKTFYNHLRKQAEYMHQPLQGDYLNDVTAKIKNGGFNLKKFQNKLNDYSIWRKIRLANALQNRLYAGDSVVYRVRNGKAWADDFSWSENNIELTDHALKIVLQSIADNIKKNVEGLTIYIPEYINYAIPATQKQFVGNMPVNSFVSVKEDLVFGIHWYNTSNDYDGRVDLDLSLIDFEKMGWDGRWRNEDWLFSGDMTNAPYPDGATELFYAKQGFPNSKIIYVNHYNRDYDYATDNLIDCKFIVASEPVEEERFYKKYTLDANNILLSLNFEVKEKQNVIGFVTNVDYESRIYFNNFSIGNKITASVDENSEKVRSFMLNTSRHPLLLEYVLKQAGANIVREVPESGDFVDLSPENLNKNTIIDLLKE